MLKDDRLIDNGGTGNIAFCKYLLLDRQPVWTQIHVVASESTAVTSDDN